MAAPMWKADVENYIRKKENSAVKTVSNGLQLKLLSLVEFIESLGQYLTNEDHDTRGQVLHLVAEIFMQLPRSFLAQTEAKLLVTYLCERLQDHHSIQPIALKCLQNLITECVSCIPEGSAEMICRAIFKEVEVQTLSQTDRQTVYNIYTTLLSTSLAELQKMGNDFVFGFIQSMDTEKDPRNLILAFHCARTIILNFSLGPFVEEMFEVTSCYFPIDFTPPPNDDFGITREELILGLRGCLSASSKFGPHCLPLLLEKMQSDIQSAILDSLLTLAAGAVIYGSSCIKEFQGSIYRCIKQEVFAPKSSELKDAALCALKAMSTAMSPQIGLSTEVSDVDMFIKEVMEDCKRHFANEDLRLLSPSCDLLLAISAGSDHACSAVIGQTVPLLIEAYNKHTGVNQRKLITEIISKFMHGSSSIKDGKAHKVLLSLVTSVLNTLLSAMSHSSTTVSCAAVQALGEMLALSGIMSTEDTDKVCWAIFDMALNSEESVVRKSCIDPCKVMMKTYPRISQEIIPKLLEKYPEEEEQGLLLSFISIFAIHPDIIISTTKWLLEKLQDISVAMTESSLPQCMGLVTCLVDISMYARGNSDCMSCLYINTLPEVYRIMVLNSVSSNISDVICHSDILDQLATFIQNLVINIQNEQYIKLYDDVTKWFLHGDVGALQIPNLVKSFQPLENSSPWHQTTLVKLLTPVICSCPKQTEIPDIDIYLQKLTDLSIRSPHDQTRLSAAKCLAGLVNRRTDDDRLKEYIEGRREFYDKMFTVESFDPSSSYCLQQCIWFTKALVIRGHRDAHYFVKILMKVLSDETLGEQSASGFNVILSTFEDVLNQSMCANIRILYKQRFFTENSIQLIEGFQQAANATKKNYLLALSYCLKGLPKTVLLKELPQLFPMLVQSLLCDNIDLQISTMDTMSDMITDAPDIVVKYVDSLIPQLLKLSSYKPAMKMRIEALKCLEKVVELSSTSVLPYRQQVIRNLESALDDKKRLVRTAAVKTRNEWFLLGQPGGR